MPYRRTPKVEARLAETRERIIKAALKLVARGGYAAANIPAIAAEVEISAGLIYRYFATKADLFNEVFKRAAQTEIDACAAAFDTEGTVRERLAVWWRPLRAALCAGASWPGRCWPSRSIRRSTWRGCSFASRTGRSSPGWSSRASRRARSRRSIRIWSAPPSSVPSRKRWSGRSARRIRTRRTPIWWPVSSPSACNPWDRSRALPTRQGEDGNE
ncbi:TetR/AcrR family transcriptional regulator [Cupriavidus sp. ISTL7]|nr:TetR/AcrR family transcriptional regulator [Cupriavidus sp. ISTL7]